MARYFPPPQPFVGGRQPLESRKLTPPSNPPATDNPVFGQSSRLDREFWTLRLTWEPRSPRPQGWRSLVHVAAAQADDPPFGGRDPRWTVLKAWQPPPLWVFDQSVLVQEQADSPPVDSRDPLLALLSWQVGANRIPGQRFVVQPAAAAPADPPPFGSREPLSALLAWRTIPLPVQRQRVVTESVAGVVDNPPFSARAFWSSLLAWQIPRPRHEVVPRLVQEFAQAIDSPPFGRDALHPTLTLWQLPWQPLQAQRFAIQEAVADELPPRKLQAPIALLAWKLEVPHVQQSPSVVQQFIAVADDPPFSARRPGIALLRWQPPYPEVVRLPRQTVDNPPTGPGVVELRLRTPAGERMLAIGFSDGRVKGNV